MDFAPAYLAQRFFYRFADFFHHWYVDGSRVIAHRLLTALEETDRSLAIRVTLRYFFQPLYRDYTVIGRILGVIFRSIRIIVGLFVYLIIIALFLLFYLAWLAVPAAIIFYVAKGFF